MGQLGPQLQPHRGRQTHPDPRARSTFLAPHMAALKLFLISLGAGEAPRAWYSSLS